MKLGLDIGFGDVKAAYKNNGSGTLTIKFPTAIKHASMMSNDFFDEVAGNKGDLDAMAEGDSRDNMLTPEELYNKITGGKAEILFEGKKYIVGEAAKAGAFGTRSYDFLKRYAPIFAYLVVQQVKHLTGQDNVEVGMGLPLSLYTKKNVEELKSRMRKVMINSEVVELPVSFYVQGYGILVDYVGSLMENSLEAPARDMLVVDIGFNTIDIINVEGGRVSRLGSDTLDKDGVSRMTEDVISALKAKNLNLSPVEAVGLLKTGKLKVFSVEEDFSELVRETTERYVDWFFGEIESRYNERLKRAEKIILAGGGAYLLRHYVPARYAPLIHVPEKPELANARGFLRLMEEAA